MPLSEGKQALMRTFREATYVLSTHDPEQLPRDSIAEVAFVGRSNSGKSSAINALTCRRRLAHVSRTPGRTQSINFFSVGDGRYLVDLPGYGYAAVGAAQRRQWDTLISTYIKNRRPLRGLVLVMDARHLFGPLDRQLLRWIEPHRTACHILLTKSDKLAARARMTAYEDARAALEEIAPQCTVQIFSGRTAEGADQARVIVAKWLEGNKKPPVKGE